MKTYMTRLFTVLMLAMVSMGAWADVEVQIANDGKFDGGTIKYVGQTKPDEKGFVTVTITVAPDKDYTIKKNNITVVSTYPPSDPNARTRTPEIAENLTLYFKGSADADTDDPSAEREYTFNVPSGFGAWVKEAEFQLNGSKLEPTREDYSGVYYIANKIYNGNYSAKTYWYNNLTQENRWYLVPAADPQQNNKEDAYYSANYNNSDGDPDKPFLTTFQADHVPNSIWIVKKTGSKYYLIHALTGKYVKYEPPVSANQNRRSVHLEAWTDSNNDPGNVFQFTITPKTADNISGYNIRPTKSDGFNVEGYLNPAGDNWPYYYAHQKNNQNIWCTGIVGWYNNQDGGSLWPFENAKAAINPTISDKSSDNKVTITMPNWLPEGYNLRYTFGSDDPTASTTPCIENNDGSAKTIDFTEPGTLKVVIERYGVVLSEVVEKTVIKVATPSIINDGTNIIFNCATDEAIVYYTTDGTDPLTSGTQQTYTATSPLPVSGNEGNTIRAIAVKTGCFNSDESTPLIVTAICPMPTISYSNTNGEITLECSEAGATIYYTLDGTPPDPTQVGGSYPTKLYNSAAKPTISATTTIKAIATKAGLDNSNVAEKTIEQLAAPSLTFDGASQVVTVTVNSTIEGVSTVYTDTGSDPTNTSTVYTVPIAITENKTIKAMNVKDGYVNSEIATLEVDLSNTGYAGIYYLQNQKNANHYLYPSTDKDTNNNFHVKTAQNRELAAVWKLIRSGNSDYYYIIHYEDNTYLKADGTYPLQKAVTLVTTNSPDDNCLFKIEENETDIFNLKPKSASRDDNKNYLAPDGDVGKNIGLNTADAVLSKWKFINVPIAPTITVDDINVTFTNNFGSGDVYYTYQIDSKPADPTKTETVPSTSLQLEYGPKYYIKAVTIYDEKGDNLISSITEKNEYKVNLISPLFTVADNTVTITNSQASGVTFRYTLSDDGNEPTNPVPPSGAGTDGSSVTLTPGKRTIIKAIAYNTVEGTTYKSGITTFIVDLRDAISISSFAGIDSSTGRYKLTSNFSASESDRVKIDGKTIGSSDLPFSGTIEGYVDETTGEIKPITLSKPLFECVKDATIRNIIVAEGDISGNGAIAGVAKGQTRIYNCGYLGGTITGSGNVGGIVGEIQESARVINCYSFATVSGGSTRGGIVGNNNVTTASKKGSINTMVMNCMFYGTISNGGAPVYNGKKITNAAGSSGLNNFNYYSYDDFEGTPSPYNCALAAEKQYLERFEFHRNILNSNHELAAWYATGSTSNSNMMAKWVLDKSIAKYPILKKQGYYPSVINYEDAPSSATISVSVSQGSGAPAGASIGSCPDRKIYDKDIEHHHYNHKTIRLPYYWEVGGTGNYTHNKVMTGWDVSVTGGSANFTDATDSKNFANRDNFSGRVFSQGAYLDIPEGATSVSITSHWADCVYLSDPTYDVTYSTSYTPTYVGDMGVRYGNNKQFNGQTVYTTFADALSNLNTASGTVYDNAIVLVGNYHQYCKGTSLASDTGPFTVMSADLNNDGEPDYTFFYQHTQRRAISPVRFDFLNFPGVGLGQKVDGTSNMAAQGIFQPQGWFEVTNTCLVHFTQFEYDLSKTTKTPVILLGGIYDQFVSSNTSVGGTSYIHLGSNAYFPNDFCNGTHVEKTFATPHIPISVTGGEYRKFYLSGTYRPDVTPVQDNAVCYIDGGYFTEEVAGAGQEKINGNVTWNIINADITNFYGGGINDLKSITGDITVNIKESRVDEYCGGPKFGNMATGKKVTTTADDCTFGKYFGAGYGGTSFYRYPAHNEYQSPDYSWSSWAEEYTREYKNKLDGENEELAGISTSYEYEYVDRSGAADNNHVGRFYINYASLSLAETHDVESTLTGCTIKSDFYGGGNLGKVSGDIESKLTDCTVYGSVFGGGYSAAPPTVEVWPTTGFVAVPSYNGDAGVYKEGDYPDTEAEGMVVYTWSDKGSNSSPFVDIDGHWIHTDKDLTTLGQVEGDTKLTIDGDTYVQGIIHGIWDDNQDKLIVDTEKNTSSSDGGVFGGGDASMVLGNASVIIENTKSTGVNNVFGGGNEADVQGNTIVDMSGGTITHNVYGGGKGKADNFTCDKAMVGVVDTGIDAQNNPLDGGTTVTITNGRVKGDVYGGGEVGRVERNTSVTIGEAGNTTLTPIVEGHVFGAGKGLETHGYSALVRGNATVTIQGKAAVWQNVHGGGEKASVGRYYVAKDQSDVDTYHVRIGMPCYLKAGGKCTVNIQDDAVIGKDGLDDSGDVYGAGQGIRPDYRETDDVVTGKKRSRRMNIKTSDHNDSNKTYWDYYVDDEGNEDTRYVWEYFTSYDDYLLYVETLARASETDVVIGGKRETTGESAGNITPSSGSPTIKGSVYGGSESGFVYYGTMVNIPKGTVKGDAFGGGKGLADFQEAGRVKRNTSLTISGGTVEGNVYGGGSLGDVGTIDKTDQTNYNYTWTDEDGNPNGTDESKNTGVCNVYMTGGTVGAQGNSTANHASGHVFGAGKGSGVGSYYCEQGMVYKTNVSISKGTVYGNVYGGGEVGRVENNATVKIGPDSGDDIAEVKGSVFGAGAGLETHGYSALVRNNTDVTVQGHAKVRNNVYGGGEIAAVGRYWVLLDPPISGAPQAPTGTIVGMPYQQRSGGVCTVIVKGQAEIGPNEGAATDLAGHVFGGGKGVTPHYNPTQSQKMTPNGELVNLDSETDYKEFLETLALVTNTSVTIGDNTDANGAVTVKGSVFGGSENGFVQHNTSVSIQKGSTIGTSGSTYGNVYGGGKGLSDFAAAGRVSESSTVAIGGGTIWGSVYGGGTYGYVKENVTVNVTGGEVKKDVYGGGALAHTNTANWTGTGLVATYPYHVVTGLTVGESVVTGFYTESSGTYTKIETANTKAAESTTYYRLTDTRVNLLGGLVKGDAYGGGLGDLAAIGTGHSDVAAMVYGDVSVTLGDDDNATKFNVSTINDNEGNPVVSSGRVFGCNNLNGSPMGSVLVTVNKTVAGNYSRTAEDPDNTGRPPMGDASPANRSYEVAAVYGGGNLSDYVPYSEEGESEKRMPRVRLTTCDISVEEVYGGGNAAKVPATDVQILGAYEIENVFGGGNGADKYTLNGTDWIINPGANVGSEANPGDANTLMKGGYIHSAYGGSNLKGEIFGTVYIDKTTGGCDGCPVQVDKMVAAGNNADFNSDVKVVVGCQGSDKTPMRFFGADNANVNGNVEVTITSGHFGKVFAGNNIGGAIRGHIIMNIEETSDCEPIRIDELYLGGNEAAYSRFGYYIKTTTSEGENATGKGAPTETAALEDGRLVFMPRKSEGDPHYPVDTYNRETNTWTVITDPHYYPLYDQPVLNIISCTEIKEVFGGGYGDGAVMYANPTVNINMIKGSNYTNISATDDNPNQLGEIGEVFGGGNAAVVEGNTTVNVGMATTVDLISTEETGKTVLGAYITGSVFGGGNEANVTGDTHVNICGTQNPVLDSESNPVLDSEGKPTYTDTSVSHSGTTGFVISIGNSVYGGGNAADVLGNTFVTFADGYVFNGIFGGGLSGSVGTFATSTASADVNIWGHTAHNGTCIGKPTACTSGGTCYVVVCGGQIGPVTVATEGMNRKTNGHGDPVPQGWVWGAGCGLVENPADDPDTHFKTYVNNTDVTIKGNAFILESIIGGGEFGRVLGNTLVKIEGGQIGVGENKVDANNNPIRYTEEQWAGAETAVSTGNASNINTYASQMPACSHFPYGKNTGTEQAPNWVYETYDPYADLVTGTKPYPGGSTDNASDGKTWIGCVFAGGSGYMPYTTKDNEDNITGYDWVQSAGWVEGNAEVRISGGHILTNVYGGNEYTDVKGTCKVTMTGGTVGVPRTVDQIMANPMIGHIFGAGKGDPRVHFNKVTNVGDVEVEITGGIVYGSVFGGGEDGHVLRNVKMTIDEGAKIGTWGTTYIDGNVFGGGRGYSGDAYTAGNVAGSVEVEIKGGQILGSVYGGGQLGSVGYGLFDEGADGYGKMRADNETEEGFSTEGFFTKGRGHIDLTISGGTIGNSHEYIMPKTGSGGNTPNTITETDFTKWSDTDWTTWKNHNNIPKTEFDTSTGRLSHTKGGNVFAGGMGRMYQLDGTTPISSVDWWKMGCVKSTKLTISGEAKIKSTVFGGGELGQVVGYHTAKNAANQDVNVGTEVIINGGTIGTEIKESGDVTRFIYGSVFGGGYGSLVEKLTHTGDKVSYPKYIAGRVKAGTKVAMTAGTVLSSVYGGGKMAAVGESKMLDETEAGHGDTHVIISGGTIGKAPITLSDNSLRYFGGAKSGNVYGGGSGHNNTVRSGHIYGNTNVTINAGTVSGEPKIYHNVYGGGAYGSVGDFDYQTGSDYEGGPIKVKGINGLATTGTGVATVTITGGTIGYDGKENGMVFGSSRGDINKPGERDDYTAWVYDTHVTIGTSGSDSGPQINGTVYGSGENGHTFNDTDVKIYSGTIGIASGMPLTSKGVEYSGAAYPYRGNVYGGGCGTDTYWVDADSDGVVDEGEEHYNPLAGIVQGTATVNITGGHVVHNVYGAGAMGSVGTATSDANSGKTTINISGGRIGYDGDGNGHVFGAARGEFGISTAVSGLANVRETEVNISYPAASTPIADNEGKTAQLIAGSVFGGGEAGTVKGSVAVNMTGGLVLNDVYGGGALADTNTENWDGTTWADETKNSSLYTTTVNLTGGSIGGDAFGGGLGQKTGFNGGASDIEATVYGDITVNLGTMGTPANGDNPAVPGTATAFNISYEDTGENDDSGNPIQVVQSGRVFGCNNLNGSPQGNVTVNVYKTVSLKTDGSPKDKPTKDNNTYELADVYGGGNLADYTATGKKASVIIHTCDVSVQDVYGGGNAAKVSETDVLVKGAWEIDHVFGGGNGKDKYKKGNEWITNAGADVLGNAKTLLIGGYIHEAYGGSNEKGTIEGDILFNTNAEDPTCDCALDLRKIVGSGKNAEVWGDIITVLGCQPEAPVEEYIGGADNADVHGNVELTITSGTFGKVFGGNNIGGVIEGHIKVNIEETGCRPIVIGELYGCGNDAAYSVYGYKLENGELVPRTSMDDGTAANPPTTPYSGTQLYADPEVNVISCTSIGKVFGGGLGEHAIVYGNPTVNINQIYGKAYSDEAKTQYDVVATSLGEIGDVFGGGNKANVVGNTHVNIGTLSKVKLHQNYDKTNGYSMSGDNDVIGANITGNVYGGGNEADVTGNTNVVIGKQSATSVTP